MTNYWAIAIGINQYQHLQPLMYAQRDATALREFWVNEAGFPQNQCLLLSDTSSAIEQDAVYPNRENIQTIISQVCQHRLKPGDFLWCFFSGYGVQVQGRDYWMPIEGDPAQASATGISIESIFASLQKASTENIVLVLDMNRSQGTLAGEGAGAQTIALAQETGIPTLLSCAPDQFSHETLALRQGLFTAALLEGLRYQGCMTLDQLVQYLSIRLPELSEHHWRPKQEPIAIIPAEKQHQLLLPGRAIAAVGVPQVLNPVDSDYGNPPPVTPYPNSASENGNRILPIETNGRTTLANGRNNISNGGSSTFEAIPPSNPNNGTETPVEDSNDLFWKRLLLWGGAAVLILFLGVLLRNLGAFTPDLSQTANTPQPLSPTSSPDADHSGIGASPSPFVTTDPGAGGNLSPFIAPVPGSTAQPLDASGQSNSSATLDKARAALQVQNYSAAAQRLEEVPANQRTQEYNTLLQQVNQGLLNQARATLSRPRALTATNQASDFNAAVQYASRIKQGQPLYEEAQQDANRWSQMILDLAKSRASQTNRGSTLIAARNYSSAIAAARLVPTHQPEVRASAQGAIAQWSQMILDLAKARAAEGRLEVAIRAAELVPSGTPAYKSARTAIDQWEQQLGYYY